MEWLWIIAVLVLGIGLLILLLGARLARRPRSSRGEQAFAHLGQIKSPSGAEFFPESDSAYRLAKQIDELKGARSPD